MEPGRLSTADSSVEKTYVKPQFGLFESSDGHGCPLSTFVPELFGRKMTFSWTHRAYQIASRIRTLGNT
ncbi:MAG TPA: hypothetical protein VK148_06080 [Xanthobacteraceae bacterium]|jgi:hypothetical protein|nr:hypothetical protein [Xanthobacteraceae bacterium]